MMKITISLAFLFLFTLNANAGFVLGYQVGTYTPAMANTQVTMHYYNKVYNANFKYNNLFRGVFVGVRYDEENGWISLGWNKKQNEFSSEYTNSANESHKLAIRTKMNELVLDGGFKFKKWGIGGGFNMANLDVRTKRGKVEEYDAALWGYEYGQAIKLFGLPNNPSFSLMLERHFSKLLILRTTYHFGIGDITFANDGTLTFYDFKATNITAALLLNLGKF